MQGFILKRVDLRTFYAPDIQHSCAVCLTCAWRGWWAVLDGYCYALRGSPIPPSATAGTIIFVPTHAFRLRCGGIGSRLFARRWADSGADWDHGYAPIVLVTTILDIPLSLDGLVGFDVIPVQTCQNAAFWMGYA